VADDQGVPDAEIARRDAGSVSARQTPQGELTRLDERIADPRTPLHEALVLTRIRGEIVRQNEFGRDRDHARRSETRQFWGKLGFSAVGVATGIGLVAMGFRLEGFVVIGIGFHWLAPDFVRGIYDRIFGAKDNSDAE